MVEFTVPPRVGRTERALRPSTSKPERGMSGTWFLVAAVVFVVGSLGAVYAFSGGGPSSPPPACVEALDAADDLLALHDDALDIIAQVFDAFSRFELDRAEDLATQLDADKAAELRSAYDLARKECRDN